MPHIHGGSLDMTVSSLQPFHPVSPLVSPLSPCLEPMPKKIILFSQLLLKSFLADEPSQLIKWQPQAEKTYQPPKEPGSGAGPPHHISSLLGYFLAKWLPFVGVSSFAYKQPHNQEYSCWRHIIHTWLRRPRPNWGSLVGALTLGVVCAATDKKFNSVY